MKMMIQTFRLERVVHLIYISQSGFSFECDRPVLDVAEDRVLDLDIQDGNLEDRRKIIHELPRSNFV
jgi:hypothetical protein